MSVIQVRKYLLLLLSFWLAACFHQEPQTTSVDAVSKPALEQSNKSTLFTQPSPKLLSAYEAYERKISDVQVEDAGTVVKLLPDDTRGLKHQKFLVKVDGGITLLFAHNIDLAARIADLQVGDTVEFKGEYVYNPKGGIMHWTHHDPRNQHAPGWIKHNGKTYE